MNPITALDLQILHFIHGFSSPALDSFMKAVTYFGEYKIMFALVAVLSIYKGTRHFGIQACIAQFFQAALGPVLLKLLVQRPRPFLVDPTIELIVKGPKSYSFPSGHSCTIFAFAFTLFFSDVDKKWKLLAFAIGLLVAISRIYLQVHYPTDVLTGFFVGALAGVLGKIGIKHLEKYISF